MPSIGSSGVDFYTSAQPDGYTDNDGIQHRETLLEQVG